MIKPIELPDTLWSELEALAKKDKRSLCNYIQIAMENHVKIVNSEVE